MAIMQHFSKWFKEKKTVDAENRQETLTEDSKFRAQFLDITNSRYSQRKWSGTLSHICNEDIIFPDQFR